MEREKRGMARGSRLVKMRAEGCGVGKVICRFGSGGSGAEEGRSFAGGSCCV